MKLIVITIPETVKDEAEAINALFESGLEYLHLRKPDWTEDETSALLDKVESRWLRRIVLHDHYRLIRKYPLRGIHLNGRNPAPESDFPVISASCHSLNELMLKRKRVTGYLFLSPVFDSISKKGYRSGFSEDELREAGETGCIGADTVALGGVTPEKIPFLIQTGFAGVAVLGGLWSAYRDKKDIAPLLERFETFRQICLE